MTQHENIDFIQQLISCKNRSPELAVPKVLPIRNVNEFMSQFEKYNGDIEELKERLGAQTQQCRRVLTILREKLQLKVDTLAKLKADMLALTSEMKEPTAATRFVTNHEKIKLTYLDESEPKECEMPEALEWFSLKMGSLYCEIMGLDSDVDYISYLERISLLNIQTVIEFNEKENKEEPEKLTV